MTLNKQQQQFIKETIDNIISEITTTGNVAGYNLPLMFTRNNAQTVTGFDEFNKQQKSGKSPTKKTVEKKIKQKITGDKFKKLFGEEDKENIDRRILEGVAKKLLKEADPVAPNPAATNLENPTADKTPEELKNDQQTDSLKEANKILYEIVEKQLPYIYNKIFIPYFSELVNKLDITNNNAALFPLLKTYLNLHGKIKDFQASVSKKTFHPVYASMLQFDKLFQAQMNSFLQQVNLTEVEETIDPQEIHKVIVQNAKAISSLCSFVISPIVSGYVNAYGIIIAGTKTPKEFSEIDLAIQDFTNYFNNQKQILEGFFEAEKANIYGSFIPTKSTDEVSKIKFNAIKIPTIKVYSDNVVKVATSAITRATQTINKAPGDISQFITIFVTAFDEIGKGFEAYQQSLLQTTQQINVNEFVNGEQVDKQKLTTQIKKNDKKIFDQNPDKIVNLFTDAIKKYIPTIQQKQNAAEHNTDQIKATTAGEYINNVLKLEQFGQIDKNQITLATVVAQNLTGTEDQQGFYVQRIGSKDTTKEQIGKTLYNSVVGNGSLVDCLQNWSPLWMKNELMLYAAKKISFQDIMKKINDQLQKESNERDNDDNAFSSYNNENNNTLSRIDPLYKILDKKQFSATQNGHDLSWKANQDTSLVIDDLLQLQFIKVITKLPQPFWDELIFNLAFYKDKLFNQTPESKKADKIEGVINQKDVDQANEQLANDDNLHRKKNATDPYAVDPKRFVTQLKEYSKTIDLPQNLVQEFNVTSLKGLMLPFIGQKMKTRKKEEIFSLGVFLNKFVTEYFRQYQSQIKFNRMGREGVTQERQAEWLAIRLLSYDKNITPSKDDIDQLKEDIYKGVLSAYDPNRVKEAKENHKTPTSSIINERLADVCKAFYNVLNFA